MPTTVVVIGDTLLDVHVAPHRAPRSGGDVPAAICIGPGGQGANVAVRLARRGVETHLVTAIGPDDAGGLLCASLEADGVRLHDLGTTTTGAVVVLLDAAGERTMLSQRIPLAPLLSGAHLPADAGWLVVSGYVLLEPGIHIAGAERIAQRLVLGCSLDTAQAGPWSAAVAALDPHLVIVNLDEARILAGTGGTPLELSRLLAARLGAVTIVTHPAGAAAAPVEVTVPERGPAVDTTGAGDAFAAELIAQLRDAAWPPGADLLDAAMARAVESASEVAGLRGAQARVE